MSYDELEDHCGAAWKNEGYIYLQNGRPKTKSEGK